MKRILVLTLILILLAASSLTLAQTSGYTLEWWTVDGGGGISSNNRYTLRATMAQPDAGAMENGRYTLLLGYWDRPAQYGVYLPVAVRP